MMDEVSNDHLKAAKWAGIVLVVTGILNVIGNALHPRFAGESDAFTPQVVGLPNANADSWQPVHLMLFLFLPVMAWAFVIVYQKLKARGQTALAIPGVLAIMLYVGLSIPAIIMDGFVSPLLSDNYVNASGVGKDIAFSVYESSLVFALDMLIVAFISLFIGMILLGLAFRRAKLFPSWLAWSGIVIGVVGLVGYPLNLFGKYLVFSEAFHPFAAAFTLWTILVGVFLFRQSRVVAKR